MTLILWLIAAVLVWKVCKRGLSANSEAPSDNEARAQRVPRVAVQSHRAASVAQTQRFAQREQADNAKWIPSSETVRVQGVDLPGGLFYVGSSLLTHGRTDPALIDPRLPVARRASDFAEGMDYWPAYGQISPANRGAYLSWLADGRKDPNAYIGYVFLFLYGLERRALVERADLQEIRAEVGRLQKIYGANRSFRGYSSDFLAFTAHTVSELTESQLHEQLFGALERSELARLSLLAWYCQRHLPLPPECAAAIAGSMEEAKRGVVVTRSRQELYALFAKRYLEQFGRGITLEGAAREARVVYRAASASLSLGQHLEAKLPNPLGRPSQFKPLINIWNACVEDLRKYASVQRKAGDVPPGELTSAMWEAMPAELRAQYDHPDQERWDSVVLMGQACGHGHLVSAMSLGELSGAGARERYTSAQLRKAANTAAVVGFAIEPDPRVISSGYDAKSLFVLWRSEDVGAPDVAAYLPAATVLKLAMHIAQADGTVDAQELVTMSEVLETLFALDESLRMRLEHLRDLLVVQPVKAATLAKKIAESSSEEKRLAIGRLLVAIAAADGVIQDAEHKALRAIYKALQLSAAALDGALATTGVRLASDEVISVSKGAPVAPGSAVTAPSADGVGVVRLNQQAIEAILADTREVAGLLAEALGESDGSDEAPTALGLPTSPITEPLEDGLAEAAGRAALPPWASIADDLDPRYLSVLFELSARERWTASEVRALASRTRLMPGAIVETINAWADDTLGDYLIVGDEEWTIRTELLRSNVS